MKKQINQRRYQNKYEQKNKDNGLVRVNIWVPDYAREHIKEYARELREEEG